MDELQLERQRDARLELSRLADVCRNESVPDAFQTFVAGIPTLTKTERRIFDGYAAGLRTREIVEQLDIKDSTLRFHNKNICSEKLGGSAPSSSCSSSWRS
ncbi:MAG: LuxR C-terminal-related transcriptional regulator [Faecalibacterium prausnitzii]